jgi:hypothetical protein
MGVTESQPKILNQKINYRYDRLNIDDLDKVRIHLKFINN